MQHRRENDELRANRNKITTSRKSGAQDHYFNYYIILR